MEELIISRTIKIGDNIQFRTNDGAETGEVRKINENTIIAYMYYLEKEVEMSHDCII